MRETGIARCWEATALLLIILLAAVLRFYRLTEIPPGLHFDEGFKGFTARSLLEGAPPKLFFESDMGEEPIAMYLVAGALALVGRDPWVIRLPSALVGTLTIPMAWWLGREVFRLARPHRIVNQSTASPVQPGTDRFGAQIVGLGTALALAILYWHLSFSRIGMEPILVPFFVTLAFAAFARGLNLDTLPAPAGPQSGDEARIVIRTEHKTGAGIWFALAGLALAASLYTYKAGYFVPILAVGFVAYAAMVERGFLRRHGRGLLVTALVALIVAAPIVTYFVTHPANFIQRPTSVSLVGAEEPAEGLGQIVGENLPRVLGMFFVQGDANPRSNLPGRPALDPFLAILFLIGLVRALLGFRRPTMALPLLWLGLMILPTLTTEYAPHFGRAIGATPAVAYLCGLGGWMVWKLGNTVSLRRWGIRKLGNSEPRLGRAVVALLLGAGFLFSGASTALAYFQTWGNSPDLFYAYDVGLARIANQVNAIPDGEGVYLTPTSREHFTLQYLIDRPYATFDGRAGRVFPPSGQAATFFILLREDDVTLPALQQARPDGEIAWTLTDGHGRPYAAAYHLPASDHPAPAPDHPVEAKFDGKIRLLGYDLKRITGHERRTGTVSRITLYWQALAPMDANYTMFVHVLGAPNPATGGPLWAGHDSQPVGGHYPTTAWQPGETILDLHPLTIPVDAPPGDYQLATGLYSLETMVRLSAVDAEGNPIPDNAVLLGTIEVGE